LSLDKEQLEAVMDIEGPSVIYAGPGSGKSRCLAYRVCNLIDQGVADESIMAVTFTNKAVDVIDSRLKTILGRNHGCVVGTFHSIAARILRRYGDLIGLPQNFTIYDSGESFKLLTEINGALAGKALESLQKSSNTMTPFDPEVMEVCDEFRRRMKLHKAVDFNGLVSEANKLLSRHDITALLGIDYIMVDEAHDMNPAQMEFLRLMRTENVCLIGDINQSIYAFRDATPGIMGSFLGSNPGRTHYLKNNYRSGEGIVNISDKLIANNASNIQVSHIPADNSESKIKKISFGTSEEEAEYIGASIKRLGKSTAVLFRVHGIEFEIIEKLASLGIEYKTASGTSLIKTTDFLDTSAYMRLLYNPYDYMAFIRAVSSGANGIGKITIPEVANVMAQGYSVFEVKHPRMVKFQESLAKIANLPWVDQIHDVLKLLRSKNNLVYLQTHLLGYTSLHEFVESNSAPDSDCVSLMTIHQSKGMEFDNVFVIGLEDGMLPHYRAMDMEEERRLLYVAMTRAAKSLHLSYVTSRRVYGREIMNKRSRFLDEI